MTFEEYQTDAVKTAIYPRQYAIIYPALGVTGEAGEIAEKVKKMIRDDHIDPILLHKEIGDVLWYLAALCGDLQEVFGMQYSLENAAKGNIAKLQDRANRGKIGGSGDVR